MDPTEALNQSLLNLINKYLEASANPKPDISLDGKTISWSTYLQGLSESIERTKAMINGFDPCEHHSVIM